MKELSDIIYQLSDVLNEIDKDEYEIVYKGLSKKEWVDSPTLFRGECVQKNISKESESIEELIRHYPEEFYNSRTIDVMTQLQHYECRTRLLDVTYNFLVALFFACGGWEKIYNIENYKNLLDADGVVRVYYVRKEQVKSINSETVTLISNIARLKDGETLGRLEWFCQRDWGHWQNDDDLIVQNMKDINSIILVKPKLNNPRIRAQFGAFFLFGGLSGLDGFEDMNKEKILAQPLYKKLLSLEECDFRFKEVVIPAGIKLEVLEDLKNCFGISFDTLCPEKKDYIKTFML